MNADDAYVEPGECKKCLTAKLKQPTVDGGAGIDLKKYHGGGTWVARDGSKICKRTDEVADEGMMARIHENPDSNLEQRTYVFDGLFTALKEEIEEVKTNGSVTEEKARNAQGRLTKLRVIFAAWAEIQRVMRITRFLYEDEIAFLEKRPAVFVSMVRELMGIGRSKKLHEIEAHLGEFARKNGCCYLLSEEGAESKHAEFAMRNRVYFRIQNMADRLGLMTDMERFANSDIAQTATVLVDGLVKSRKRPKYAPRKA